MTATDRFERELPDALTDLVDAQTPDYFIDLLGRTARTRQRPTWAIPGRWIPTMPALTTRPAMAVVAIVIVAILGGAFVLSRSDRSVGAPSPSPTPNPTTSSAVTPPPSALSVPSALAGGWVAPWRDVEGIAPSDVATIVFIPPTDRQDEPSFALDSVTNQAILFASVHETAPDVIELVAQRDLDHCTQGDAGQYRWTLADNGAQLTLDMISDPCAARAAVLSGSWSRSGAYDNAGGTLVNANFEPYFTFTLPAQGFIGWGSSAGVIVSDNSSATFKAWQDPDGFADPCDDTKGRIDLAPGIDPFVQYLTDDSGLTVSNQRETTVDGYRAVIVDVGGKPDILSPCWTNPDTRESGFVLQWAQHADPNAKWATEIGSTPWPVVITEVGGHTLVFEIGKSEGGTWVFDQTVLDSIRFLDALPSPNP